MLRTIVVPLDGSALAERALPHALRLAQFSQGRLVLMRAAQAAPPRTLNGTDWELDQAQATAEAERYLQDIAESLSGQVNVEIATSYGPAAEQILATAFRLQADALVMATHGRTGLPHLLYGSVTESVLAASHLPVLVVNARPGEAAAPLFSPYSARILVPQDGSEYDAPAVDTAVNLLGPRGQIILLRVVPSATEVLEDDNGRVLEYLDQQDERHRIEASDYLSGVANGLRNRPLPIPVELDARLGEPTAGIISAAAQASADLIVMATHGRTGIRRAVVGSVAGDVLRSGVTPVVLIHPPVRREAEDPVTAAGALVDDRRADGLREISFTSRRATTVDGYSLKS